MLLLLLLSPVQACTGPALFCQQDLLNLQKNNPADQDYLVQTPEGQVKNFNLKGIVWEIYECFSDVFSHLGRMFGMIFRVQWGQKSPKSGKMCLTKMYPGPCKGAAGRSSISGAAPSQGHGNIFGQTRFSTFWQFLTPLNPKNPSKHHP